MNIAIVGGLVGIMVGIITVWTSLMRFASAAARIELSQQNLHDRMASIDQIPTLIVRVGNLENFTMKNTSDIKGLIGRVNRAEGEQIGRRSRPDPEER